MESAVWSPATAAPSSGLTQRLGVALASASCFGLSVGMHRGGSDLLWHALYVPFGLMVGAFFTLPALYVALSFASAPLSSSSLWTATVHAIGACGRVLAGLAPLSAMHAVTSDTQLTRLVTMALLCVAGAVGVAHFLGAVRASSAGPSRAAVAVSLGFSILAAAFAMRTWVVTLPIFGGLDVL